MPLLCFWIDKIGGLDSFDWWVRLGQGASSYSISIWRKTSNILFIYLFSQISILPYARISEAQGGAQQIQI